MVNGTYCLAAKNTADIPPRPSELPAHKAPARAVILPFALSFVYLLLSAAEQILPLGTMFTKPLHLVCPIHGARSHFFTLATKPRKTGLCKRHGVE